MSKDRILAALAEVESVVDDLNGELAELRLEVEALPADPPPPPPVILSPSVTPNSLPYGGGMVTITAAVMDATELLLDGVVIDAPLPWTVECLATRTFVLGARGPGGEVSVDLPVTVAAAPPAPPDVVPVVKAIANLSRCLVLPGFYFGGRYDRFQTPVIVRGPRASLKVFTQDIAAGGTKPAFGFVAQLGLTFDGQPVAFATTVATANEITFDVPLAGRGGWHTTSLVGAPANWSVLDYALFVDDGSGAVPTHMPVVIGSYGLMHPYKQSLSEPLKPIHVSAMVPAKFEPVTQAIRLRECPAFATDPRRDQLVQVQPAICRQDDKYRTVHGNTTAIDRAILHTANRQDYFYDELSSVRPKFQMLDGPRGRGTVVCPTHLEMGTAAPPSMGFVGNIYFCEPQRFGKVRGANGDVVTLAGYRHRAPPSYWNDDTQDVELVGNWDAIPVERRGFRKLWGMTWNSLTFKTDTNAPRIPMERDLQPHLTGIEVFVSDSLNNRVIKGKFDPMSHATPVVLTEFYLGLECWDVVELGFESGRMAISERMGNRVVIVNIETAAVLSSFPTPNPEGLYFLDDWLYYGSRTTKAIRKRNVVTGEDLLAANLVSIVDDNAKFVKFCVSDGTFGPRGMLAVATWSNNRYGYPALFRPNGTEVQDWLWAGTARPGAVWIGSGGEPAPGYTSACGIGFGRMLVGTAQEGVMQLSKALSTDAPMPPEYFTGQRQWYERGYQQTHGHRGFGFYGLAQPWGVTPEIDVYLTHNGHLRA